MRNNAWFWAFVASLLAMMLYTTNTKNAAQRQVRVVQTDTLKKTVDTSKKSKSKSQSSSSQKEPKEPNVKSIIYSNKFETAKGSNKSLINTIKRVMGQENSYQVQVNDLKKSKVFAGISNNSKSQQVDKIFEFYMLAALYQQEKSGKITASTAIKVKSSDMVKGDKLVTKGIAYGPSYLRSQMLKGSRSAANALLGEIGRGNINSIAKSLGATNTQMTSNFSKSISGKTTAKDLAIVMSNLYKGKVLGRSYSQTMLKAIAKNTTYPQTKLTSSLNGTIYEMGDDSSAVALIEKGNHTYVISVWADKTKQFNNLGRAVNTWMMAN